MPKNDLDYKRRSNKPLMIVMTRVYISALLFFCVVSTSHAQEEEPKKPAVAVLSRALNDSILLRWAPTTPIAWELSNKYGYMIERVTILRNHKLLDVPEKKSLTDEPVKVWPMAAWEKLVDESEFGAIAGQALFGETFEITENMSSDMMQVVNKAKELEMRFSFALFSADQSLAVARASGLYYVDKDIVEGEKYLYRVYSKIPMEILKIDTGYVYVGTMDYAPLPQPLDLNGQVENKSVELSWNRENFDGIYNSYYVERADDGSTFKRINKKPIVNAFQGDEPKSRLMFKVDSLPQFNVEYLYRVRGITPFGEVSPPSDTIKVVAYITNDHNPIIIEKTNVDNESIRIGWEFDETYERKIKGFSVLRTPNPSTPYDTIVADLSPATRTFLDKSPDLANYYVVAAQDHAGNFKTSFPALAQLVDSIPPIAPRGLIGIIDTTGLVTLTWTPNEENDLWGYRVYRANYEEEEYSQLTVAPIETTIFYDTIPLKNLTKQIYYKIMAIDQRDNPSIFCEPLKLIKPDLLPPVAPVIENVESTSQGVILTIIPSSSEDVVNNLLYRRNINQANWQLVYAFDSLKTKFTYTDSTLYDYKKYTYTLIAVDDSGLESEPARSVEGKKIDKGNRDQIKNLYAEANRNERFISIEWKYDNAGVDKFLVYKDYKNEGFRLYKTVAGDERKFIDRSLQINTVYKYKIMAVYNSGARSPLSKEVEVNY
jgi:uncharacterized protein